VTTPRDPGGAGPSGLPPEFDPRRRSRRSTRAAAGAGSAAGAAGDPAAAAGSRRRGHRTARILSWVAAGTSAAVLAVAVFGFVVINHYNGNINRLSGVLGHLPGADQPAAAPHGAENYLLVGSDSRSGANGTGTQGTGATFVVGQRSDTVILVHLYGGSDQVQLVSFPRDSYVEIPAYTDPKTGAVQPAHHDKLNASFSEGGPKLLIATIQKLTNIQVDHYLQIDFTGFKGMVNALGGVDVCLTKAAKEKNSGIDLSAGNHHINGDVALSFVRQRYGLPNGDIDRIKRQQDFIGSLVRKVASAGTLLNPFKLTGFLDIATSSLQVDENLSTTDLKNLALRLRGFSAGGVLFSTVNIADLAGRRNGAAVVLLDDAKNAVLFDQLRQDRAPEAPAPTAPAPAAPVAGPITVAPNAVRVRVYNGSGVTGLGRKAATDLQTAGFSVIGVATNRGAGRTQTTITFGAARADSARTLAAALPGSTLMPDPTLDRTLEVVVGSGYSGTRRVTVTGSPAPTASAPPSAAPKPVTAQDATCAP
jgi:LCP family protein required for cell wall assembly